MTHRGPFQPLTFYDYMTTSKSDHFIGPIGCLTRKPPTLRAALRDRHKRFHGSCSTHQSVCIHEDTFAIMSQSPTVKLSEGYAQFWPPHQSQTEWVRTVKCIHLDDFVKHTAKDRPTRASSGEQEGSLERFIRVQSWHGNSDTQKHDIFYDTNKG